jgi:hypothetical protein
MLSVAVLISHRSIGLQSAAISECYLWKKAFVWLVEAVSSGELTKLAASEGSV